MAIEPLSLALMATNVGASIFNNWRNNRQSHKLQEKQQEFARAAAERNKQRMWQLMREGQELTLEIERETHKNRLEDIQNDFNNTLRMVTFTRALEVWPLTVLPIVMKNQSLGTLIDMPNESIAMHCIFTPSNCTQFNKYILPAIEDKLTDFCNFHWGIQSSHPILFYSGAWKTRKAPTGIEVEHLKTNLNNLPTLLITPFFKPEGGIEFQLKAWGIGVELETDIECSYFSYAESYKKEIDYQIEKDIKDRTIEEFVPYLQCLIGYIADQYFWTCYNKSPLLPTLLTTKIIKTDGMPYLKDINRERYNKLYSIYFSNKGNIPNEILNNLFFYNPTYCVNFLYSLASIDIDGFDIELVYKIIFLIYQYRSGRIVKSLSEIDEEYFVFDDFICISKLIKISKMCNNKQISKELLEIINNKTSI
ncbi:MAG: hypothetical protein E7089_05365 [Bacteroidales bacterium]|nr:hypothetical protein [Bacteroidales bacterium]